MSFHNDLEQWRKWSRREGCPVCRNEPAPSDNVTIHEFPTSWLEAHPRVCLRGTCYLLAKPHAVELYDLSCAELSAFMAEAQIAARALKETTGAVRINYEVHGNTVPHLHLHLFPRYVDDPFPGAPIDYRRIEPPVYREGEFQAFIADLRRRVGALATAAARDGTQSPIRQLE